MTIDIGGIGPAGVPGVTPAKNAPAPAAVPSTSSAQDNDAVTVDVQSVPASPPPEVSAAIQTASQAYDQLAAAGQHVKFSLDSSGGLNIELQHDDGTTQTISGSEALRLAGGGSSG